MTIKKFPRDEVKYPLKEKLKNFEVQLYDFVLDEAWDWAIKPGKKTTERDIQPYLPSPEAREIISLAQRLKRPILLQGEPGSGKTKLAQALAIDWYGADYHRKYFEWHIKSTSKAVDGLYLFDHIARLRDAHNQDNGPGPSKSDLHKYLSLGPLGKAFLASDEENPAILLIDEIDKADIDFPNDLLLEIDESRFRIQEPGIDAMYKAPAPPLIFITSNKEKALSPAFLRRCLYLYLQFPNETILKSIMDARYSRLKHNEKMQNALIERFSDFRLKMKNAHNINRMISTSEFLDWAQAVEFEMLENRVEKPEDLDKREMLMKFAPTLFKGIEELKLNKLFE